MILFINLILFVNLLNLTHVEFLALLLRWIIVQL